MPRYRLTVVALLLGVARASHPQPCAAGQPIAFIGVDVLTMAASNVVRNRTVVVDQGRIATIGVDSPPTGACRIEARGKVLMPGLADMHAHVTRSDLPLFLANGVTLVREMNGTPGHVAVRDSIARGQIVGPRLLVASPLLTGKPLRFRHRLVASVDDARTAAYEARSVGYDFLKIYDDLTADQYAALVEVGKKLNFPIDGHVPESVGLRGVLEARQAIQHMDKIVFSLVGHSPDTAKFVDARHLFDGRRA